MRIIDLSGTLLFLLIAVAFWLRKGRLIGRFKSDRALLLQSLILGFLIGVICALRSVQAIFGQA